MPALPECLRLVDGHVALCDWSEGDAPALQPVCGEVDVCQFTSVPWTYTPAAALEWIRRQHARRADGTGLVLAVTRADEDAALGTVSLVHFGEEDGQASLGYWLVPAARGRGLAVAGARMLCRWGFLELGLKRIELAILPANRASLRVAEKLGAVREGVRTVSQPRDGRLVDMVIHSLRRPGSPAQAMPSLR